MAIKTENLAIMFTDIKGFTSRTSKQSREDLERLLEVHDDLIKPAFHKFGGNIVKTIGDAFLVTFKSPTDAVLCGMEIQNILRHYNEDADDKIEVRVAINAGEVNIRNGDVFGEPVNIAARIEGITDAGHVNLTEAVYLAMNKNEILTKLLGKRKLKGVPHEVKVYKVVQSWEGSRFLPSKDVIKRRARKFLKYGAIVFLFLLILTAISNDKDSPTGAAVSDQELGHWLEEAKVAIENGDQRMSQELIRQYVDADPKDPPAFVHMVVGVLSLVAGENHQMIKHLERAVEKKPENREVWQAILDAARHGRNFEDDELRERAKRIEIKARRALA